jgi:hypothetical protein
MTRILEQVLLPIAKPDVDNGGMLYRILADAITSQVDADIPRDDGDRPSGTRLRGAWASGGPCSSLDGLRLPPLRNRRVRFWYTEEGWRVYGRAYWGRVA